MIGEETHFSDELSVCLVHDMLLLFCLLSYYFLFLSLKKKREKDQRKRKSSSNNILMGSSFEYKSFIPDSKSLN